MRRFSTAAVRTASARGFATTRCALEKCYGYFITNKGENKIFSFNQRVKITDFTGDTEKLRGSTVVGFDVETKEDNKLRATNVEQLPLTRCRVFAFQKNGAGMIENAETKELYALLDASPVHSRSLYPGVEVEAVLYDVRGLRVATIRRIVSRALAGTIVKVGDLFYIIRVNAMDGSTAYYYTRKSSVRSYTPLQVGDSVNFDIDESRPAEEGKLPVASSVQVTPVRSNAPRPDQRGSPRPRDATSQHHEAADDTIDPHPASDAAPRRPYKGGRGRDNKNAGEKPHRPAADDDLDFDDADLFKSR